MSFNIEIKNISFDYSPSNLIIDNTRLKLNKGEVVGILANAGLGKSTLLKLCAGLLIPTKGELIIDGKNFWSLSTIEQNDIRSEMGFDFQDAALITNMTISGNLLLPLNYHEKMPEQKSIKIIDDLLKKFGLYEYKDKPPALLSHGLKRSVSFIRALLSGNKFFFWDDPIQGRSEHLVDVLKQTILEKRESGIGSLIVTQDENFLKHVSDRVVILDKGKLI
ncbi:MAG: hypothetical protein COS89_05005 [Deltaproteobacteria bacterium CG07_land_8_20_14_0_80_38_7]|nr:MAG: hypothetical protein COS89_05005 [Deltaproteobacteria bacterium CG07_land_8_20_14_0_80_38_7]